MIWFYISFATREGHRGSTVVAANDIASALDEATRRGLNPGGEAQIIPVPPHNNEHPDIVRCRNRLVSKAELMTASNGYGRGYHENSSVVCEQCNEGEP
jgi:hypothetical protein